MSKDVTLSNLTEEEYRVLREIKEDEEYDSWRQMVIEEILGESPQYNLEDIRSTPYTVSPTSQGEDLLERLG